MVTGYSGMVIKLFLDGADFKELDPMRTMEKAIAGKGYSRLRVLDKDPIHRETWRAKTSLSLTNTTTNPLLLKIHFLLKLSGNFLQLLAQTSLQHL